MADSVALRVRRSRLHKAGDHSLCKRCAVVRGGHTTDAEMSIRQAPAGPGAGASPLAPVPNIAPAAAAGLDPVAELRQLAADALAAYRRDTSNAMLLRECRATLLAIPEERPAGNVMDELRQMASRVS